MKYIVFTITLRNVAKALNFFSSLETSRNSMTGCSFLMGITSPLSWVANLHSSREDSPLRIFFSLIGKRINLLLYSFKRWILRWRDSIDLFLRLRSTAIPTVLAKPAGIPAPWKGGNGVCTTLNWYTPGSANVTYLQFFQGETAASTQFGVVADGWTSYHRAEWASCWAGEDSLGFLYPVLAPANFTGGLVEPSFYMSLPPLVEVSIWNHIVSLTHFCCLVCKHRKGEHN